jgi:hypothetical protein
MAITKAQFEAAVNTGSPLTFLKKLSGLAELRKLCEASVKLHPEIKPLESFVLVGGTYLKHIKERPFHNGHGNRDSQSLCEVIFYCLRSGIPVSPKFLVHLANFLHREDYLKSTYESDVVILGHLPSTRLEIGPMPSVYNPRSPLFKFLSKTFKQAVKKRQYKLADEIAVGMALVSSPDATPEKWVKRLDHSGAKLIFSSNAEQALSVGRLTLPHYEALLAEVPNRHKIIGYDVKGYVPEEFQVGYEIGINKQFLKEVGPHLNDRTLLGHEMHSIRPRPRPHPHHRPRRDNGHSKA